MIKVRNLATLVAIGALAGLTGCSALGMGGSSAPQAAAAPPAPPPAPAPAPAPTPGNELSHQTVRQIQTALKHNGDYRGRVDGVWGPMTQNGVSQFQQKNGLQATGALDEQTLQALHVTSAGGTGSMGGGSMNSGSMNNGSMNSGAANGGATNDNMGGGNTSTGTGTGGATTNP
jgi:peptidoglycan hydrolase-like protein with peptidoglycan-binding domain